MIHALAGSRLASTFDRSVSPTTLLGSTYTQTVLADDGCASRSFKSTESRSKSGCPSLIIPLAKAAPSTCSGRSSITASNCGSTQICSSPSSDVKQREDVLAWPRMKAGTVYEPAFRTASAVVVVFHRQIFGVLPAPKRSGPDGNVLFRRNAYSPTNADLPGQDDALASSALSQDGGGPVRRGGECGACRANRPLSFRISAPLRALFTSHDRRMGTLQRGPGVANEVPSVGWSNPLGAELFFQRELRRMLVAATIIGPLALAPETSSAEGLLDFFFGGSQKQQSQTPFFANIFNTNLQPPRPRGRLSKARLSQPRDLASACAAATENIFR